MFYAHFVLSKKGPLARIWLAAHWDKKLTKAHVFETNIEGSVEAIIQPKVKLALRTSGHLLLGVVRIYSRKAKYLLADCNEAFVKIKMAFRPGVVDLPEENREAAVAAITLPETFHDFDTTMADLTDIDVQTQFTVNQSRPEEITMREDLGNITLVGDDGFGDMGFGTGDNMLGDVHMDDTLFVKNTEHSLLKDSEEKAMDIDLEPRQDGFGEGLDYGRHLALLQQDNLGGGLFEEPPPLQPQTDISAMDTTGENGAAQAQQPEMLGGIQPEESETQKGVVAAASEDTHIQEQTTMREQTTLIPNEAEAFALEPIDVTSLGTDRIRTRRKRKLIIDVEKGIPSESMKIQLSDTSDIVTTLDLAPPTKKLMHWKETGGVEKLFALSAKCLVSKRMAAIFNDNLVTKPLTDQDFDHQDPVMGHLGIDELEHETRDDHTANEVTADATHHQKQNKSKDQQPDIVPGGVKAAIVGDMVENSLLNVTETERARATDESLQVPLNHTAAEQPSVLSEQPSDIPSMMEETLHRAHNESDDDNYMSGPPSLASRRYSSEVEENEDNLFNQELPTLPEDATQEPGENAEDMEEKRWKGRTQQMMHIVQRRLRTQPSVSFHDMISTNNRKQVASKFYTLLVLKKLEAVSVEQNEPFGDIHITEGPKAALVF